MLGSNSIWNIYIKLERAGGGVYGKVYKAKSKTDGTIVAVKKTQTDSEGTCPTTCREIALLKRLSGHPNIVQ